MMRERTPVLDWPTASSTACFSPPAVMVALRCLAAIVPP